MDLLHFVLTRLYHRFIVMVYSPIFMRVASLVLFYEIAQRIWMKLVISWLNHSTTKYKPGWCIATYVNKSKLSSHSTNWTVDILETVLWKWKFLCHDFNFTEIRPLSGQLKIDPNWPRQWVGVKQATNNYLSQWWPNLHTQTCGPASMNHELSFASRTTYMWKLSSIWGWHFMLTLHWHDWKSLYMIHA